MNRVLLILAATFLLSLSASVQVRAEPPSTTVPTYDSYGVPLSLPSYSSPAAYTAYIDYTVRCSGTQPGVHSLEAYDGLVEVNDFRRRHSLPPYTYDPAMSQAAASCALYRAQNHITYHTSNDFAFVPAGSFSPGAGCACWRPGTGFGSCRMEENWKYAGAAWVIGSDGMRYMHLFVRN